MYETVLVAVDGSEESFTAAHEALDLTADGGTLHVLSVVERLPLHRRSGQAEKFEDDSVDERAHAEEAVSRVEDRAESTGVDCVTAIEEGVPRTVIMSYADDVDADAIVLGKRGLQDVADDMLGSTTERIVRKATVPVVSVPDSRERP